MFMTACFDSGPFTKRGVVFIILCFFVDVTAYIILDVSSCCFVSLLTKVSVIKKENEGNMQTTTKECSVYSCQK